ncbi:transposase family protein [Streptomyces viridosporus]|uniref:transposase family protein n=1 Tax=Streptomyces viridosporus TaxID=67581 RepID=UPI0036F83DDD
MVTCVATLDVPRHVVEYLGRLLAAHRRRIGTPRRSRTLGPFRQAVLVLRWFRERGCVHCLARDAGVSDVEPGSVPDITAARIHVLPALYKAAVDGLPTLADKDYIGAGIGLLIPVRRPKGQSEQALHADTRMYNTFLRHVRAFGERTAAELKQRWRTLQYVTLSPSRIGDIARAALVLNGIWK